jgi:hypothetical protein
MIFIVELEKVNKQPLFSRRQKRQKRQKIKNKWQNAKHKLYNLSINFWSQNSNILKVSRSRNKICGAVTSSKNERTNLFFYPDSPEILET